MKNKSKLWEMHQDNQLIRTAIKNGAIKVNQIQQMIKVIQGTKGEAFLNELVSRHKNNMDQLKQLKDNGATNQIYANAHRTRSDRLHQ